MCNLTESLWTLKAEKQNFPKFSVFIGLVDNFVITFWIAYGIENPPVDSTRLLVDQSVKWVSPIVLFIFLITFFLWLEPIGLS